MSEERTQSRIVTGNRGKNRTPEEKQRDAAARADRERARAERLAERQQKQESRAARSGEAGNAPAPTPRVFPLSDAEAAAMDLPARGPLAPPVGQPLDGPMETFSHKFFGSENGVIHAGLWEVSAGRMRADFGDDGEMVHVVKGTLHAIPDNGEPFTIRTGDTATFPPGWTGIWELREPMRKLFCVFDFSGL